MIIRLKSLNGCEVKQEVKTHPIEELPRFKDLHPVKTASLLKSPTVVVALRNHHFGLKSRGGRILAPLRKALSDSQINHL